MALPFDVLLEPHASDEKFGNPHERAFIAAVRGWADEAAFVDVLLDLAHVARQWESKGGDSFRADELLRLRDEWMKRHDPECHADEVRDARFRPRAPR